MISVSNADDNCRERLYMISNEETCTTQGPHYKLHKQHSSCTARSSFFTERVAMPPGLLSV